MMPSGWLVAGVGMALLLVWGGHRLYCRWKRFCLACRVRSLPAPTFTNWVLGYAVPIIGFPFFWLALRLIHRKMGSAGHFYVEVVPHREPYTENWIILDPHENVLLTVAVNPEDPASLVHAERHVKGVMKFYGIGSLLEE